MARQVGKYTVHLSESVRAGTRALVELWKQGHIPTVLWFDLRVEPIDNHGPYSDAHREMVFTIEGGTRVKVKTTTWKRGLDDQVGADSDDKRKWDSYAIWIERNGRMASFSNNVGNMPWTRWPDGDEPIPGQQWRAPTPKEIAAYQLAAGNRDREALTKLHFSPISWDFNILLLGKNTYPAKEMLQAVAMADNW